MAKQAIDHRVKDAYVAMATGSRESEIAFIETLAGMLAAGTVTVRVAAASIREAQAQAKAPSVRHTHAQDIVRANVILKGAKDVHLAPVGSVLTMATRLRKGTGSVESGDAMAADLIDRKVPFLTVWKVDKDGKVVKDAKGKKVPKVAGWDLLVPATNGSAAEGGEGDDTAAASSVKVSKDATADAIIAAALAALRDLDDLTVKDKSTARSLLKVLEVVIAA